MSRSLTTVAVLLFDGAPLFETAVPISVFGVDRTDSGVPRFDLLAVAADAGPLVSTGGVRLHAPCGLEALDRAGVIIVPSWRDPHDQPTEPVLDTLRRAHADGAVLVSLCMGAF